MSKIDVESLGFTQDEIKERIVDQLCEQMLNRHNFDYAGDRVTAGKSSLYEAVARTAQQRINEAISKLADEITVPAIETYLRDLKIQPTNGYGEKKADPMTFLEFVDKRLSAYFTEEVDSEGRSSADCRQRQSSFYSKGTRVAFLIDKNLQSRIETAMSEALKHANESIVGGIQESVKLKLAEISQSLKLSVKLK